MRAAKATTLALALAACHGGASMGNEPDASSGSDGARPDSVIDGAANITPTDVHALAFSRTTAQVLNIVYAGGASGNYGFFPQGLNGTVA